MPDAKRIQLIHDRLERSEAAKASFARIGEELKALRKDAPPGPTRERLDMLIQLNTQTAAAVRRSQAISERDLGREK